MRGGCSGPGGDRLGRAGLPARPVGPACRAGPVSWERTGPEAEVPPGRRDLPAETAAAAGTIRPVAVNGFDHGDGRDEEVLQGHPQPAPDRLPDGGQAHAERAGPVEAVAGAEPVRA